MLDLFGAILLPVVAAGAIGTMVFHAARGRTRAGLLTLGAAWFLAVAALGAAGISTWPGGRGTMVIGAAILVPVLVVGLLSRTRRARPLVASIPLEILIGANVG